MEEFQAGRGMAQHLQIAVAKFWLVDVEERQPKDPMLW